MSVKLKGENRIEKFRRVAERLVSEITRYREVCGIVFTGGLVRGFTDKFSDLDMDVFLRGKNKRLRMKIYDLGLKEGERFGIEVDLEVYFLREFKKQEWDEVDKWEYSKAEIVYDPEGEIRKIFEEKLRVSKNFWIKRIAICSKYLKWYCCPLKKDACTIAEAWVERGDPMIAHYCINYAIELLIEVIFALNKEFLPPPKWRIFYSYKLKWLPKDYKKLLKEAIKIPNFSSKELNRRLKAVRRLWDGIIPRIEKQTGFTTEQLIRYYIENVPQ